MAGHPGAELNLWRRTPLDDELMAEHRAGSDAIADRRLAALHAASFAANLAGFLAVAVLARQLPSGAPWPIEAALVGFVTGVVVETVTAPADRAIRRASGAPEGSGVVRAAAGSGLALAVLSVAFQLLVRLTSLWWLVGALVFIAAAAVVPAAYPSWMLRRGKAVVLEDERLERRLVVLSREAGVPAVRVMVLPAPPLQSPPLHAAFTGYGRGKSILVTEPVLEMAPTEIEVVLAHEVGHVWRTDWAKVLVYKSALLLGALALVDAAARSGVSRGLTGADDLSAPATFPVVAGLLALAFDGVLVLSGVIARRAERQADLDALDITRDPDAFESAIRHAAEANAFPMLRPWWQCLTSPRTEPLERLALARWWRANQQATMLFTDVVSSTDLLDQLGERHWYEQLAEHNEILRRAAAAHGGTLVENPGDGFLFAFDDAGRAVLAAIEMQRQLDRSEVTFEVRMGVHTGDVIRRDGNLFGREVHYGARLQSAARGGEILVSAEVRRLLDGPGRFRFGPTRKEQLKGFEGEHEATPVAWREITEVAALIGSSAVS